LRVEQRGQLILREQECSEPSSAVSTRSSSRRNGVKPPFSSKFLMIFANIGSKWSVGAPPSIWRMWLSQGTVVMPNSVSAFDRPQVSASVRWWARNNGLCMKNTEKAESPMSAIA
jgi:hypothetical protein